MLCRTTVGDQPSKQESVPDSMSLCLDITHTHHLKDFFKPAELALAAFACRWVEAAPHLLQLLMLDGVLGSGGSIAPLASGIAHSCLQLGLLQNHLHNVIKPTLKRGCEALTQALRTEMPTCGFEQPLGGYFVWLDLGAEVSIVAAVWCRASAGIVSYNGSTMLLGSVDVSNKYADTSITCCCSERMRPTTGDIVW